MKPYDFIDISFCNHRYNEVVNNEQLRLQKVDGLCPTLTTRIDNYALAVERDEDMVDKEYEVCDFRYDEGLRSRSDPQVVPTIPTHSSGISSLPMLIEKESEYSEMEKKLFTEDGNIRRYVNSSIIDEFKEGQMATTTFPNGYGHGTRTHDESVSLNTIDRPSVKHNLRIRKLTPRECWRLMGFSTRKEDGTWDDEAFDKASKVNSNAQLYKQAGNSIVVDCLEAIFQNLFLEPDHEEFRELSLF